jgi:glycosyltransferase involved in cell wall biosynthesis
VFAGADDGYLGELRQLVNKLELEKRVIFTGPIFGREKLEAYIDADVYVLPSIYEIFGVSVLEACACALPVIVTDRCGIADVVDGVAGIVVPYDRYALSEAILDMLRDNSKRQYFGQRGKTLVLETFNWGRIAEQVEDIYENCLYPRR